MRVFVTGGTGAIGGHVLPALVAAGHEVSALVRSPEKAARVEAAGATPVEVSLYDRDALAAAFAGHDAMANLATAIPPTKDALRASAWAETVRIRTEGSEAVVGAVLDAGVGRLVQESIVMAYPDRGDAWIDEDVPLDDFPTAEPVRVAEANARRVTEAGGTGVVLRFGLFYGPGAASSAEQLAAARRHVASVVGRPSSWISSIHLADAAAAVVAALEAPAGTYNVVDDEPLTTRAFAAALGDAVGRRPWLRFPGGVANLLGDRTTALTRSLRVSNRRFREATGWAPQHPSAREGWRATVAADQSLT